MPPLHSACPAELAEPRWRSSVRRYASAANTGPRRHGVYPRKTFTVKPWEGPEALLAHYYRGVFEGDGSIFKAAKHRGWTIAVAGTLSMMEGLADFVRRQVVIDPSEIRPAGRVFQLKYWRVTDVRAVLNLLYGKATCWLERKKAAAEEALEYLADRRGCRR